MVNGNKLTRIVAAVALPIMISGCVVRDAITEIICPQPGTPRYEKQQKKIKEDKERFAKLKQAPKKEKSLAESLLSGGLVGATIDLLKEKPKTEVKDPNNYSENNHNCNNK